ncbi:MAG: HNH endonuclease signature motif containing protein [Elainellaceae cyanobacterium]
MASNHRKSRWKVYRRDGFRCVYCQKRVKADQLTLDHVIPKAHGGSDKMRNLVAACFECNSAKGSMDPKTWVTYLGTISDNIAQVGKVDGLITRITSDPVYRKQERQAREAALEEAWQYYDGLLEDIGEADMLDD